MVCEEKYSHVVKILSFPDLDIDYKNGEEGTALEIAAKYAQYDFVKLLIEHGASVNNVNDLIKSVGIVPNNQIYQISNYSINQTKIYL